MRSPYRENNSRKYSSLSEIAQALFEEGELESNNVRLYYRQKKKRFNFRKNHYIAEGFRVGSFYTLLNLVNGPRGWSDNYSLSHFSVEDSHYELSVENDSSWSSSPEKNHGVIRYNSVTNYEKKNGEDIGSLEENKSFLEKVSRATFHIPPSMIRKREDDDVWLAYQYGKFCVQGRILSIRPKSLFLRLNSLFSPYDLTNEQWYVLKEKKW